MQVSPPGCDLPGMEGLWVCMEPLANPPLYVYMCVHTALQPLALRHADCSQLHTTTHLSMCVLTPLHEHTMHTLGKKKSLHAPNHVLMHTKMHAYAHLQAQAYHEHKHVSTHTNTGACLNIHGKGDTLCVSSSQGEPCRTLVSS